MIRFLLGTVAGSRFSEKRLTGRAGFIMVTRFARKLGLEKIIDEMVHVERYIRPPTFCSPSRGILL
jgi:hypothetical protein